MISREETAEKFSALVEELNRLLEKEEAELRDHPTT
jgi:hypothetical protein